MLNYSARKHLQIFSKVGGRETDAGSSGYISQSRTDLSQIRTDLSQIRFHTSATQQSTQKNELGSQHQISLMESTLIPALKDVQASLKQLTASREIVYDDKIRKLSEVIGGGTPYRPSSSPTAVL